MSALIGVMLYTFARVSAAIGMRVRDYEVIGRRASVVLHEKRGKFHRVPAHHKLADALDAYRAGVDLGDDLDAPWFRATDPRARTQLTTAPMTRRAALYAVKRRAADVGLPYEEFTVSPSDIDITLQGWWMPAGKARATLVFLHGGGSHRHRIRFGRHLQRRGGLLLVAHTGVGKTQ